MELDEGLMDLYSRQIGAFGLETMAKLTQMRVLIVGMGGVGVEIAKNLTLAGPKAVTILDAGIAEAKDMGSNFFITEGDLGGRRGASRARLRAMCALERRAVAPLLHCMSTARAR
jgi:ubiquitin-activating enzyme E1